ncbi:MAG: DnaJ domain-containing protein [Alphaproteobacteria bacterium]|nr:DnaJ domain-containing protein [Alphaproteobacteria bacterium]
MPFDALGYFSLLEADDLTDEQTLKISYREKAKFWHPDHNKSPEALEMFQKLSKAYDILKNKKQRAMYRILSLIYTENDFPSLERLNTYKSADGIETPYLRVFAIQKIEKGRLKTENLIGTYEDALHFLKKTTFKNFINGFFSPHFYKALQHNIHEISANSHENLKVLVHNAAAFYDENKLDLAYLSALQALEYANQAQRSVIENFMRLLPPVQKAPQKFNTKKLRAVQLKPFLNMLYFVSACAMVAVFIFGTRTFIKADTQKINYYQTVHFEGGEEMADDMVGAKIFNIPVDKTDDKMLFHMTSNQNIMHGPSDKFDVLTKAVKGQTVRLTGYTADKIWYRIMLDNGQTGFIKGRYLKKGIGNLIPEKSQIILQE